MSDTETNLGTNNIKGAQSKDFSRIAPGELVGVGQAQHNIDETKVGPQAGGAVSSEGQGGDRVWRDSLLPEEKKVLKRYFD